MGQSTVPALFALGSGTLFQCDLVLAVTCSILCVAEKRTKIRTFLETTTCAPYSPASCFDSGYMQASACGGRLDDFSHIFHVMVACGSRSGNYSTRQPLVGVCLAWALQEQCFLWRCVTDLFSAFSA